MRAQPIQDRFPAMKVLILSDYAYLSGGAEVMIYNLREALRARGLDVRIFSTSLADQDGNNFADYTCLGTLSPFRTLLQTANPFAARSLARVLQTFKPDIVHARIFLTQLSPLILPQLRAYRSIYHLAWYRSICPKGTKALPGGQSCNNPWGRACLRERCLHLKDWLPLMAQMTLLKRWIGVFDRIVANSEATQARFAREGILSQVIYNGVTVPDVPDGWPDGPPTVSFAGRLVPEKGCATLLRAFGAVVQVLPNARLVIAGEGPDRRALASLADQLKLQANVLFLGKLSNEQVAERTKSAWVQVVPSLWEEPFGLTAVEPMMLGRPVIASASGGLSEIVEDGATGYLVPPGNADILSQRLISLLHNAEMAQRMGQSARRRAVEKFSIGVCADQFAALYAELMSQTGKPTYNRPCSLYQAMD